MSSTMEKAIRENFPGKDNAGLRAEIRSTINAGGSVMAIAKRIGLTGHAGLPSLKAIAALVESETK